MNGVSCLKCKGAAHHKTHQYGNFSQHKSIKPESVELRYIKSTDHHTQKSPAGIAGLNETKRIPILKKYRTEPGQ